MHHAADLNCRRKFDRRRKPGPISAPWSAIRMFQDCFLMLGPDVIDHQET